MKNEENSRTTEEEKIATEVGNLLEEAGQRFFDATGKADEAKALFEQSRALALRALESMPVKLDWSEARDTTKDLLKTIRECIETVAPLAEGKVG